MRKHTLRYSLLFAMLLTSGVYAQVPNAPQPTPSAREEGADDPFGRSTPRGTVLGFIKAVGREDYAEGARYLDTEQPPELAGELARQLGVVLDRETSIDLSKLSRRPEGTDPHRVDRELVGVAHTSNGPMEIWLIRLERGDNPPIWLFSEATLELVPEVYEDLGSAPEIDRHLPSWLKAKPVFSVPLWRLCGALILVALVFVVGSLLARFVKPLLANLSGRMVSIDNSRVQNLVPPLRLALTGIVFLAVGSYSYTLLARNFWHDLGSVLIALGVTWLLVRIVGIAKDLAVARLNRIHSSDRIALVGLLGRLAQIGVLTTGTMVLLYLAGVNLTAALTGLGIGGLAVAFASQKTLENLFGGIMIISDRPVRIGDVCKAGEVTGVVLDIGLRSTRIRTLERTIVTIPNGQLATMNLENYTARDKFRFYSTIGLRHQTTIDQMQMVLHRIREILAKHPNMDSETARVQFISIGTASQNVEIQAYVFASDYNHFLRVQEELLLQILNIVESAGTALALPTQISHVVLQDRANARDSQGAATSLGG